MTNITTNNTLSINNARIEYKPFGEDFNLLRLDFEVFLHRLEAVFWSGL
jgi:hypothetical protein